MHHVCSFPTCQSLSWSLCRRRELLDGLGTLTMGALLLALSTCQKCLGAWINQYVLWLERCVEYQPLQTAAATQRYVRLPRRKGAAANIDRHSIERLALRLVNGYGPGQL